METGKIENGKSGLGLVVERFVIVGPMANSVRDSIRMQTADSQVPSIFSMTALCHCQILYFYPSRHDDYKQQ